MQKEDRWDRVWLNLCSFVLIPAMLLFLAIFALSPCIVVGWIAWLIWGG